MNKNLNDDLTNYITNHSNCSQKILFSIWKNGFHFFLKTGAFTDATLISSDFKSFHVHKLLLASCSEYFKSLFIDNLSINNSEYDHKQIVGDGEEDGKFLKTHQLNETLNQSNALRYFGLKDENFKMKQSNITNKFINASDQWNFNQTNSKKRKYRNKKYKLKNFLKKIHSKNQIKTNPSPASINEFCSKDLNNQLVKSNASIENRKFQVFFPDIDSKMLSIIINFIYTGDFNEKINHSDLLEIIVTLDRLSMNDLIKILCQFLMKTIEINNCISIYQFTKKLYLPYVEKESRSFILYNFIEVYENDYDFSNLTYTELAEFLSSDSLNVNENDVFQIIIDWVNSKLDDRIKHLIDLIKFIRFNYIDSKLFDKMKQNPLITQDQELTNYLNNKVANIFKNKKLDLIKQKILKHNFATPRIPGDVLFSFGGVTTNYSNSIFESYDCRIDKWFVSTGYKINKQLAYHSLISHSSDVYLIGGTDGVIFFNEMFKFDSLTGKFHEKASMHQSRCYLSSVILNNFIYVMGGCGDSQQRLNTVERYDFNRNQWTYLKQMNFRRSDGSAEVFDGKIYIAGGFDGTAILNSAEFYSPTTNQWTMITSMQVSRSGFRLINYRSELYAIGGNSSNQGRQSSVEKYCPKKKKWNYVENLNTARSNFASVVFEDKIYVIGGFDGSTTIDSVEVYDRSHKWIRKNSINMKRSGLMACVIKNLVNAADYTFKNREFKSDLGFIPNIFKINFKQPSL